MDGRGIGRGVEGRGGWLGFYKPPGDISETLSPNGRAA